jgi:serine/threonine protein kinase
MACRAVAPELTGRKLCVDVFHRATETSPMPEQELPINGDSSLESSGNFPPDFRSIGETRLISLISNHSAESDVWLGEQADGKQVAVKIYRHGRIPGLIQESHKCALSHPNLVPVIEAGEVQGRYFEISPFVSGGTLADLIQRRGRLPEPEVEAILYQLSDVIHYLHSRHVLHRDIKPSNIFIIRESPLQVALADFGTARLGAYQTMLTGSVGTVAYSSPEAVTGIQSEAADYWSLGMVLLETLTGRRPFEGLDVKQQLYRVASGKIEIPEAVPAGWKALFAGLLRADYTERWRKSEIDHWQNSPKSIAANRNNTDTTPAPQLAEIQHDQSQGGEDDSSRVASEKPRSRSTAEGTTTPILRRSRALLVREPETITLKADEVAEVVFNRALRTVSRFFWLAFLVDWESHNAWAGILLLGTAVAIGVGTGFLPHHLERVRREVRVNRQLAEFAYQDQRFVRRLVRRWMRSLRRASRDAER